MKSISNHSEFIRPIRSSQGSAGLSCPRSGLFRGGLLLLIVGVAGLPANVAVGGSPASSLDQSLFRVSTISINGMPRNIVPKGSDWNFGPGSLWTHNGWQYAAYWDDACQVSVARRQLPSDEWSVASLPGYRRTENINRSKAGPIAQGFGNSHEKVAMGISPDGVIHLAFDHHVSTLLYRTSKLPVAADPAAYSWSAMKKFPGFRWTAPL